MQIKFIFIIFIGLWAKFIHAENTVIRPQLAPGYGILEFTAPKVGSYQLNKLGKAHNGRVLTTQKQSKELFDFMGDKVVLLSFIYATCSDVNGCPLATMVFHKIKKRLLKEPELAKKLRLLTLSFNPLLDTPEKMRVYGKNFQSKPLEWKFLTTESEKELQPILKNYQQNIQKIYNQQGEFTGTFSHLLRVYLIDKNKTIRNIYSVDFLHADTLINDMKTLLEGNHAVIESESNHVSLTTDDTKHNYQHKEYQTHSTALKQRQGKPANLLKNSLHPPLGLPAITFPKNNSQTREKIALGRKLFYDRRLSINNTFSCAMCHIPEQGFGSDEMATSVGVEGRTVRRNAPTLYNVAYMENLFHDGRENTLEQQAWSPLLAHNEMANPSIGYVINKIKQQVDYKGLFEAAFNREAGMETIGKALASYQRSLNAADSDFDRWHYGKQTNALSNNEKKGYALFIGKAGCNQCHLIHEKQALLMDQKLHNTGIGYQQSMAKSPEKQSLQIAAGQFIEVKTDVIKRVTEPKMADLGLYEITEKPTDRWKYKTPTLRNIELTAPYMHNGQLQSLEAVVDFYNQGGIANENLDSRVTPLNLSTEEQGELVSFLKSLTGNNVDVLVSDGLAAPIGEP
ncbi:MAG: cytochrome c peroxidase [Methylococcales bacterium]|nr:cytochrome c peroxidase [Methylococcales bacterium]